MLHRLASETGELSFCTSAYRCLENAVPSFTLLGSQHLPHWVVS